MWSYNDSSVLSFLFVRDTFQTYMHMGHFSVTHWTNISIHAMLASISQARIIVIKDFGQNEEYTYAPMSVISVFRKVYGHFMNYYFGVSRFAKVTAIIEWPINRCEITPVPDTANFVSLHGVLKHRCLLWHKTEAFKGLGLCRCIYMH